MNPLWLLAPLVLVASYIGGHHDPDSRRYRDGWRTRALFHDKLVHALAGAVLAFALVTTFGDIWTAAIIATLAGVVWEVGSSTSDGVGIRHAWRDIVATGAGAYAAALLASVTR